MIAQWTCAGLLSGVTGLLLLSGRIALNDEGIAMSAMIPPIRSRPAQMSIER